MKHVADLHRYNALHGVWCKCTAHNHAYSDVQTKVKIVDRKKVPAKS